MVIDALSMGFMQRAFAAGILIAVLCGVFSTFVVLKRLSFIGVGISHSAFGGVSLGYFLGINPTLSAVIFSAGVALLIGFINRRGKLHEDTAIGIFFALTMALGIFFIGISKKYNVDLFGYLFGNILAITKADLVLVLVSAPILLIILAAVFKELLFLSFDEEVASVSGIPVGPIYYLFLFSMAITIVLAIKVVGIILVSALLVLPAATARQLTDNYRALVVYSVLLGIVSTVAGLFLSYYLNLSSGATIVLFAGLLFFLSFLYSSFKRKR
ncbi:metal ABC transporter permease [candidate division TA06 bacterium]|uniref:Metal ABC transporter permease n=1 Tax=candidate division TA06 bacterium TaxID=2250710 RepID=A0A523UMR0_UNCT6|nr:MAG: metal ABC transporter permease [candidate division TA06 bacterium]